MTTTSKPTFERLHVLDALDPDCRTKAHGGSPDADRRCFRCGRLVRSPRHVIAVDDESMMRRDGDCDNIPRYLIGPECARIVPEGFLLAKAIE